MKNSSLVGGSEFISRESIKGITPLDQMLSLVKRREEKNRDTHVCNAITHRTQQSRNRVCLATLFPPGGKGMTRD